MAKGDNQLDTIWDFSGADGGRIVLGEFSGITMADVSFADGILTVGAEQVVHIVGDFIVGSHVLLQ
jgi:hypothetical protein